MSDNEATTISNDRAESLRAAKDSNDHGRWIGQRWISADQMPDRWDVE